jgi:hypothetical protein
MSHHILANVQGLWKAMDADLPEPRERDPGFPGWRHRRPAPRSGSISCQEFMVFMRRLEADV